MANVFNHTECVLDTFSAAISVATSLGRNKLYVHSIEWSTPTTVDHTALITKDGTIPVFSETCTVAKQSIIKYYDGRSFEDLRIAISGVGSGKIIITFKENPWR